MATARTAEPDVMCQMIEHREHLLRVAMRYTRNKDRAEDLVQDTYLRAYKYKHRFDGRHPKAWLTTILIRAFFSSYRRMKIEQAYLEEAKHEPQEERETAEQLVDLEEVSFKETISDQTLRSINSLSKEQKEILILSDLNGLNYQELSSVLGIPMGTVMSRLHRARNNFRKFYQYPVGRH